MLSEKELLQIEKHGLSKSEVFNQLKIFSDGIPFANLMGPAIVGDGIKVFSKEMRNQLVSLFEENRNSLDIIKFVPASGAASRMFQELHRFLEEYSENKNFAEYRNRPNNKNLNTFFKCKNAFAFSEMIFRRIEEIYPNYDEFSEGKKNLVFVKTMLYSSDFNFDTTPKGLIPFHKYPDSAGTAFEEQLYEAAYYASSNNIAKVHFTVSDRHENLFKNELEKIKSTLQNKVKCEFEVSYSLQQKETETIAVTLNNQPFKDSNDNFVFRPSGHGALLWNLNKLNADIIFIKNIDNVLPQNKVDSMIYYKKMLAGKLLELQKQIFQFAKQLKEGRNFSEIKNELTPFLRNELNIKSVPENSHEILSILDRPLRVCGVVKNTGAPGGGPFWVKSANGEISLQIIEMAQIDMNNANQSSVVEASTHFNPVDLVCGVKDYQGKKYNLPDFLDPLTGFISIKSFQGKPLKALELPGLWNGSMANWNTIFVEVPQHTFNPVKTVNDLLGKSHI